MSYYLLEYQLAPDYLARRSEFREAHLVLAEEAYRRGEMVLGGPLEERGAPQGLMLFATDRREIVEEFAARDPYTLNGLVSSWTVREWIVTVGGSSTRSS